MRFSRILAFGVLVLACTLPSFAAPDIPNLALEGASVRLFGLRYAGPRTTGSTVAWSVDSFSYARPMHGPISGSGTVSDGGAIESGQTDAFALSCDVGEDRDECVTPGLQFQCAPGTYYRSLSLMVLLLRCRYMNINGGGVVLKPDAVRVLVLLSSRPGAPGVKDGTGRAIWTRRNRDA